MCTEKESMNLNTKEHVEQCLQDSEHWVDTLKGITIFLVVFVHVIEGFEKSGFGYDGVLEVFITRWISIFYMPLFMAISGYVFALAYLDHKNDRGGVKTGITWRRRYWIQICNLIVVYFVFSILMFGVKYIFSSHVNNRLNWADLVKLPFKSLPDSPYWYLYVLVFSYIIAGLILRKDRDKRIILGISFATCVVYSISQPEEVITAQRIFFYFFFFYLGCFIRLTRYSAWKKYYPLQFMLLVVLSGIELYVNGISSGAVIDILKIFISILMINIMFGISVKYWNRNSVFTFLGERSLEIYLLHVYITSGIRPILKVFHIENFWFAVGIATFLGIGLPLICSYLLNKMNIWDLVFKPVSFRSREQ